MLLLNNKRLISLEKIFQYKMSHVTFLFVSYLSSIQTHEILTSRCYAASIFSNLIHQAKMASFYYPLKTTICVCNKWFSLTHIYL